MYFSNYKKRILSAILAVLLPALPALAQERKGTVAGTVRDEANGTLPSALIELQPLGRKMASDGQGQFRMADVPPGEYTLTASYVGFASFTTSVKVDAGQTVNVDAVLKVASVNDQVMVTAERLVGEAEAINIERMADDIVQVLPSRVILSLPNTNVADAVGRLPSVTLERDEGEGKYVQIRGTEPRLSNTTVDGVNIPSPESFVRNVKLDIIPADLVDRIEVSKTLSANQDADAIGGSVNLVTKSAGDRPTYALSGMGGYTPISGGRWLDAFTGTAGKRFGASKKFGALLSGSYDWNGRGINDIEPSQGTFTDANGNNFAVTNGLDTREYKYYRTRYGFGGGLDYRLGTGSMAYLRGLFSDFHDYGSTWVYSYSPGAPQTQSGGITTFDNTGSMQYREYIRRPDQQIYSVSTGARHDLASTLITYEFAISRSHQIGGFPTTYFNGPGPTFDNNGTLTAPGVAFNLDNTDPYRPRYSVTNGVNIFDPTAYSIGQVLEPVLYMNQLNFQGALTGARRYTLGSHLGTFEAGFKVRDGHKVYNVVNNYWDNGNSNFNLNNFLGTFADPSYYDKSYTLGPLSTYDKLNSVFVNNLNSAFTYNFNRTRLRSDPSDYDANERIYAGYLMNNINVGKFRIQTGVRFEDTVTSNTANIVNLSGGKYVSTTPVNGGTDYLNVLPSVQVQYLLTPNTNLRATYDMGIARPNISDTVPFQQADPNASPKNVVLGNPALKATRANNYDVLVEHYFQPLGILQAGFFYKDLSNPIYNTTQLITSGLFAGYQLNQTINGPNAHITGFEAAWEQRLSRLPGLLSGLGVSANYSYTSSQVTFPAGFSGGRTDHPSLLRQAPSTWNLGFTYDKSRFSMRFGVSHNDANIYAYNYAASPGVSLNDPILGLKGPTGDLYLYAHTQFDVQGSYRMGKGFRLIVSGLNLSNEVFGFYQGSTIYPTQREYYHPTVSAGIRWASSAE
ncbi:MAG TPA: TonB-dependent receptor [Candidatus Acidoferrum sp.]